MEAHALGLPKPSIRVPHHLIEAKIARLDMLKAAKANNRALGIWRRAGERSSSGSSINLFLVNSTQVHALVYSDLNLTIPTTGTTGTVDFPMDLNAVGLIADLSIQYKMTHTSAPDLAIFLISPSGIEVSLRTSQGGGLDEICSTDGRQEAGYSPRAVPGLQSFINATANGIWKLRIRDGANGDTGRLLSVKLSYKLKAAQ